MQPLDLTVFGPLKLYLQQEIKSRGFEVHNSIINRNEICALIAPGYAKAVSPADIISGFKKAGISPLDSSVILSNPSLHASSIPSRIDESTTVSKGGVADTLETDSDPPSTSEDDDAESDNNASVVLQSKPNYESMSKNQLLKLVESQDQQIEQLMDEKHPASRNPFFGMYQYSDCIQ